MYSLPSTSQVLDPTDLAKNFGATPSINPIGLFPRVCVPPGMDLKALSQAKLDFPIPFFIPSSGISVCSVRLKSSRCSS
jgi:hypothetical protein